MTNQLGPSSFLDSVWLPLLCGAAACFALGPWRDQTFCEASSSAAAPPSTEVVERMVDRALENTSPATASTERDALLHWLRRHLAKEREICRRSHADLGDRCRAIAAELRAADRDASEELQSLFGRQRATHLRPRLPVYRGDLGAASRDPRWRD